MKKFLLRDEVLEAIRSVYNSCEAHSPESYSLLDCEDMIESLDIYFVEDEDEQENV